MSFRPAPVLVLAGAAWSAVVMAAPLLGWSFVYAAAHLVCHQIPSRTFHLAPGPFAVCARCLGLYLGAVTGGGAAVAFSRWSRGTANTTRARVLFVAAALPTLATVLGEWFLHWPSGNLVRFVAALPLGAAAAWLVASALEVDWRA